MELGLHCYNAIVDEHLPTVPGGCTSRTAIVPRTQLLGLVPHLGPSPDLGSGSSSSLCFTEKPMAGERGPSLPEWGRQSLMGKQLGSMELVTAEEHALNPTVTF